MGCKPRPYMLQGGLIVKCNKYTPEERAKIGRYGTENGPVKAAGYSS